METNGRKLAAEKARLMDEIGEIERQLAQAHRIIQQNPIAIAARRGKVELISSIIDGGFKDDDRKGVKRDNKRPAAKG